MLRDGEYRILSRDNIDEIAAMTGKTTEELETLVTQCENFNNVHTFWRHDNRWFGLTVDNHYVYLGLLDRVMREAMEIAVRDLADESASRRHE